MYAAPREEVEDQLSSNLVSPTSFSLNHSHSHSRLRGLMFMPAVTTALPVLTLFLWETGSLFEELLNVDANKPAGIPPDVHGIDGCLVEQNSTFACNVSTGMPSGLDALALLKSKFVAAATIQSPLPPAPTGTAVQNSKT